MVYKAIIDNRRQSHFEDLEDEEVDYHLHVAALHNGMSVAKSKDVCIMTQRMDSRRDQESKTELSAQREAFIESIKRRYPGDTSLVKAMLKEVDTGMADFHSEQRKKMKRPDQAPDWNRIRAAYNGGPNSIMEKLPIPEVDILHECAHVPANQSVNHLLAFNKDVLYNRVGFEEDWLDGQSNYKCQHFQEVHGRVKAMMEADPQNVTKETRVVFVRPWSDGFEAKKIKVHHAYNNLQVFTLTLRAIRGKGTKRHTMPFGLCFKKKSHAEIFMQLLKEVHALETPRKRFFGEENRFYTTIVLIDMISADYPERCANVVIAQLGDFTHRWGFSCKYDDNYTPSCAECELARIERLLGGNTNNSGDVDKKM